MRFILYCKNDPVDLGIEDSQGKWDMEKLMDHIGRCRECSSLIDIILIEAYWEQKG